MNETQTNSTSAGTADSSSLEASADAGSNISQRDNNSQVDTGSSQDNNGNSGSSDGSNGSDSGKSGRQRSSKAERRIAELTAQLRAAEKNVLSRNDAVANFLNDASINPDLPDYTGQQEVYAAQIAKDVYTAIKKEYDAKLAGTTGLLQNQLDFRNAVQRNIYEAERARERYPALNEDNPDTFDPDITKEIDDGFMEIFEVNPKYSYASHVKKFRSLLGTTAKTKDGTTDTSVGQAVRSQAQSNRKQEFSKSMSTAEMQAWFASRRG